MDNVPYHEKWKSVQDNSKCKWKVKISSKRRRKCIIEKNSLLVLYSLSNMTEKGYFCTFGLGYLEILTC